MTPGTQSYYRAILGSWADLAIKRFKCGHEKTPENTLINRYGNKQTERCRDCHNRRNRDYSKNCKAKELKNARNRRLYGRHREQQIAKRLKRYYAKKHVAGGTE